MKVRNIGKIKWDSRDDLEFIECVKNKKWTKNIQVKFYNMVNTTIRSKFGYYDEFIKMDMELLAYEKIIKYAFSFRSVKLIFINKDTEDKKVFSYITKEDFENSNDYEKYLTDDYKLKKNNYKPFNYLYTIIYSGAKNILVKKNYKYILKNDIKIKPYTES